MKTLKWTVGALVLLLLLSLLPAYAKGETEHLLVHDGETMVSMEMEQYLLCVVAAEMPASYEMEALKAQAVAARTRIAGSRCATWVGADVCTQSACCQGYLDEAGQNARWKDDADLYRNRVSQAVADTQGIIMTYGGKPIEVLYHAISGGQTEDVEQVYKNALPYLRSVASPGEESARGFKRESAVLKRDLCKLFPEEAVDGDVYLEILERSESGRVLLMQVGAHTMTGRTFRGALSLASTNFDIEDVGDAVVISQRGYGHGVGMSQAGANAMAEDGASYRDILLHYYTGISLEAWEKPEK